MRLKLTDVDLERRTIYVHRLKKGKPTVHPIYNGELKALQDWLKIRKTIVSPFEHLFLSEQRKPLSRITVWLLVQKYAAAAELTIGAGSRGIVDPDTAYSTV